MKQIHEPREVLPKIPFRALIPKNSRRITVAGRIVSADRVALAGIRAQCTCMAMGAGHGRRRLFFLRPCHNEPPRRKQRGINKG